MLKKHELFCREDFIFMFKILLIFLSFLIVFLDVAIADDEILDSAYFIDEVHCSGPRFNVADTNMTIEEIDYKKDVNKEECEKLFAIFEVKKFSYISKIDVEELSRKIRNSNIFEKAELTLKKGEIKNHVHLFLDVKFKQGLHYSITNDFTYYSPVTIDSIAYYDENCSLNCDSKVIESLAVKSKFNISNFSNFEIIDKNDFPISSKIYGLNLLLKASDKIFNDPSNNNPNALKQDNKDYKKSYYTVHSKDYRVTLYNWDPYEYFVYESKTHVEVQPYFILKNNIFKNINQVFELRFLDGHKYGYGLEYKDKYYNFEWSVSPFIYYLGSSSFLFGPSVGLTLGNVQDDKFISAEKKHQVLFGNNKKGTNEEQKLTVKYKEKWFFDLVFYYLNNEVQTEKFDTFGKMFAADVYKKTENSIGVSKSFSKNNNLNIFSIGWRKNSYRYISGKETVGDFTFSASCPAAEIKYNLITPSWNYNFSFAYSKGRMI